MWCTHTRENSHLGGPDFRPVSGQGQAPYRVRDMLSRERGVHAGSGQSKGPGRVVGAFNYRATCGICPPCHAEGQSELAGDLSELVGVVASEGRVDCGPLCCMHEN